ncbi:MULTISPECIES: hypothetical protein [unclassified Sphingobacterium]|uniref:hypothetical protein n=1 Tax=unclassified Sphingobacterium TaxID=2609468 RepID=UPI001043DC9B|nr:MULTISPECIES: hypothetical protein [unclassified Sphingobacterium]MCS3557396.1 hypothetical protein [Sphingobacterium sp. JUb21]TCQ96693.1 hypothetical protein EDF66_12135 [Sphingobacterium sp. JUb20]
MANQFLIKETMEDMKALSTAEITALQAGTFDGVQLLGYYEKGDTPAPIIYYLAATDPGQDDGGSVIVAGNIKLVHEFKGFVDISYYGHQANADFSPGLNTILKKFGKVDLSRREVLCKNIQTVINGSKIKNGTLKFNGGIDDKILTVNNRNVQITEVVFDGNNKQPSFSLVFVSDNCENLVISASEFKNLTATVSGGNARNNSYGLMLSPYGVKNFTIQNCVFKDFRKYNNTAVSGTPTVGHGFTGGMFLYNGSEPTTPTDNSSRGNIKGCTFENIVNILDDGLDFNFYSGYLDADGIRFYSILGGVNYFDITISDCLFKNISKRAVKLSGSGFCRGIKMYNLTVYATAMQYPMVSAVKLDSDTVLDGLKFYGATLTDRCSIFLQMQGSHNLQVRNVYANYVDGAIQIAPATSDRIRDLNFENITIESYSNYFITQGGPTVASQQRINFNNCVALPASGLVDKYSVRLGNSTDLTCGVSFKDCRIDGANIALSGTDISINGLDITINNSNYIGNSTAGGSILSTGLSSSVNNFANVSIINTNITILDINAAFLTSNRTFLLTRGKGYSIYNLRLKVSDNIATNVSHLDIIGENVTVDNLAYDGTSSLRIGVLDYIKNSCFTNLIRTTRSTLLPKTFIVCGNTNNMNVLFANIYDMLAMDAPVMTFNSGAKYIVNGLSHNSTNSYPIWDTSLTVPVSKNVVIKFN